MRTSFCDVMDSWPHSEKMRTRFPILTDSCPHSKKMRSRFPATMDSSPHFFIFFFFTILVTQTISKD
ncbi:hypothetical protein [Bacillus alkalicola]|uniref:Uncharacterized protein n=1 Tax=Evansella alkalicola TaxID=745819 RepID=A0ABS6JSK3_9BACI|nr:hypothetical protein [Bacillus alkalicola]MBU9721051.1 hypothetical protein [Bacillus alkalicola]